MAVAGVAGDYGQVGQHLTVQPHRVVRERTELLELVARLRRLSGAE